MHTIKIQVENNIYQNIIFLLKNLSLSGLKIIEDDEKSKYDENGIQFMDAHEQKEIETILSNPQCHEVSHKKTITIDI